MLHRRDAMLRLGQVGLGSITLPGLLRQRIEGNQALITTRAATPELIRQFETEWQATVEVQDLNLEEIFLELHDD